MMMSFEFCLLAFVLLIEFSIGSNFEQITFDENAEISYSFPADSTNDVNRSISFHFKTKERDVFLIFLGNLPKEKTSDPFSQSHFIAVALQNEKLKIILAMQYSNDQAYISKDIECRSMYGTCSDNEWHKVFILQFDNEVAVKLDGQITTFKNSKLDSNTDMLHLKIGKPPSFLSENPKSVFYSLKPFRGCMDEINLEQNNVRLNVIEMAAKKVYNFHISGKRHMNTCLDLFPVKPVTFESSGDKLIVPTLKQIKKKSFELIFRTLSSNCLIAYQPLFQNDQTSNRNFYTIEIRSARIFFFVQLNGNHVGQFVGSSNISDGLDHKVEIFTEAEKLFVIVDGIKSEVNVSDVSSDISFNSAIYIGAVEESDLFLFPKQIWSVWLRQFFTGCIISVKIGDVPIELELLRNRNSSIVVGCQTVNEINKLNLCANRPCSYGVCQVSWNQRYCDCTKTNFTGTTCNKEAAVVSFNGYQFMKIALKNYFLSEVENINIRFKSKLPDGLLLSMDSEFAPTKNKLEIFMQNGSIYFLLNFGQGEKKFKTNESCFDGSWHNVKVERRARGLRIWIDNSLYDANDFLKMEIPVIQIKNIIVGSKIDNVSDINAITKTLSNDIVFVGRSNNVNIQHFVGHMMHFVLNGINYFELAKTKSPLNIEVTASLGYSESLKHFPIHFISSRSYLVMKKINIFGDFRMEFYMKTLKESGLVLFLESESGDYLILEMVDKLLHIMYNWGSGYKRKVSEGDFLNDGRWHFVSVVRHLSDSHSFAFRVDGKPEGSKANLPVDWGGLNFNYPGRMYLGGYKENSTIVTFDKEKPKSIGGFNGCISSFLVTNILTENERMEYVDVLKQATTVKDVQENCPETNGNSNLLCTSDYCQFRGQCVQQWTKVQCDCTMTSFTGNRCQDVSSTVQFLKSPSYFVVKYTHNISYSISKIAFGFQTNSVKVSTLISLNDETTNEFVEIGIFTQNGAGFIQMACNTGDETHYLLEHRINVVDGFYHIVRFYRSDVKISVQIDDISEHYLLINGPKQNIRPNKQSLIIVGASSYVNKNSFQGYITGLTVNKIPVMDLFRNPTDPNIQMVNKSNIQFLSNFVPKMLNREPLSLRQSEEEAKLPTDSATKNRLIVAKLNCPGIAEDEKIGCQQLNNRSIIKPGVKFRKSDNSDQKKTMDQNNFSETNSLSTESPSFAEQLDTSSPLTKTIKDYPFVKKTEFKISINLWLIIAFSLGGALLLVVLSCLIYRCSTKDEGSYSVEEDRVYVQTNGKVSKFKVKFKRDENVNQSLLAKDTGKKKPQKKSSTDTKEWYV